MIRNKYIYEAFWMICLFIYFVVVVFPIFGASEDFRDSEKVVILWFLKAIRKAQDNISKLKFRKNNQPLGKKGIPK